MPLVGSVGMRCLPKRRRGYRRARNGFSGAASDARLAAAGTRSLSAEVTVLGLALTLPWLSYCSVNVPGAEQLLWQTIDGPSPKFHSFLGVKEHCDMVHASHLKIAATNLECRKVYLCTIIESQLHRLGIISSFWGMVVL